MAGRIRVVSFSMFAVLAAACADSDASSSETSTSGSTGETDASNTTGSPETTGSVEPTTGGAAECVEPYADANENGVSLYGNILEGEPSLFDGACYSGSGPERFFTFVFPDGGPFSFLIEEADFTPRMVLLAGADGCSPELACVADVSPDNAVYRTFDPGEQVRVVIDSASPTQSGEFNLEVYPGIYLSCSDYQDEIPSDWPLPTGGYGYLSGPGFWEDTSFGSCGGMNHRDYRFTWTPPSAGQFKFTLEPEAFDGVLYIAPDVTAADSSSCTEELACADEAGLAAPETIILDLQADERVRIFVDGRPGVGTPDYFALTIEQP